MIISKRNNIKPKKPPSFKIHNQCIKHEKTIKYLGVTFSYTLSWNSHIQKLKERTFQISQQFARVASKEWGASSNNLKFWYKTVVEKIIVYAAGIWASDLSRTQCKSLSSMQRPYLLKIARAYRTTPTAALNKLTQLEPLSLMVQQEANLQKVLRLGLSISLKDHRILPKEIETKVRQLQIHPASFTIQEQIKDMKRLDATTYDLSIYTDGSKTTSGIGAAFVAYNKEAVEHRWQGKLPNHATVYQAEVSAIQEALDWSIANGCKSAIILTDNQAALKATQKPMQRNQTLQMIQLKLLKAKHIRLTWVKGHSDIEGNEEADRLAKEATESTQITTKVKKSIIWMKNTLQEHTRQLWQNEWTEATTGRSLFEMLPKIKQSNIVRTPAQTAFLTNHGPFPSYLHRFGLASSPLCVCGERGDSIHYATSCALTERWHVARKTNENKQKWAQDILNNKTVIRKLHQTYLWLRENSDSIVSSAA